LAVHRKLSSSTYAWYAAARRCITAHFMKHTYSKTATKQIKKRFRYRTNDGARTGRWAAQIDGRPTYLPVQAVHGAQVVLRKLLTAGAVLLHEVACSNRHRGECADGGSEEARVSYRS